MPRNPDEPVSSARSTEPRSDCELGTERVIRAAPERVFDAFRDPAKLARWWGPDGFTNTFHEFDFRGGGAWRFTMHGPGGRDFPNESRFVEIEAPRRVVIEHLSNPRFVAEFEFTHDDGVTLVVFRHRFESAEMCARIAEYAKDANKQNLDRLAVLVESERE
ncbi:MAG: SRPBCC domain-containing protein [Phycisphaeraceae bacterium]|nr:SRPBCC domain-containing protein [Phycisphaeraceae bacterium]